MPFLILTIQSILYYKMLTVLLPLTLTGAMLTTAFMGIRRKAREHALSYLYQEDCKVESATAETARFESHFKVEESEKEFFEQLIQGVQKHRQELDGAIEGVAENWKLSRMARVDRLVLELACFELMKMPETPPKVVIDEAVEIARKFSSSESASFVNGLLDRLAKKYRPDTIQ